MEGVRAAVRLKGGTAMASPESAALSELYRGWARAQAANPNMSMAELRLLFDQWDSVTAEPKGVDYLEVDAGGVPAMWIMPKGSSVDKVILCAHGGGYVGGSIYTHRKMYGHLAKAVGCKALSVDYALAPEHPHPRQVNDMVQAYRWLLSSGLSAKSIALAGDSAGGSLALTTVAALRAHHLEFPAATMSISPWAGADISSESYVSNKDNDVLVTTQLSQGIGALFLGPEGSIDDPLANPLRIDYAGYPPIFILVGGHEAVLNDSTRTAESARRAGVDVRLDVFPDMQHCFPMMAGRASEADDAVRRMASWVKPHLGL